jgi:hypothetical protein
MSSASGHPEKLCEILPLNDGKLRILFQLFFFLVFRYPKESVDDLAFFFLAGFDVLYGIFTFVERKFCLKWIV